MIIIWLLFDYYMIIIWLLYGIIRPIVHIKMPRYRRDRVVDEIYEILKDNEDLLYWRATYFRICVSRIANKKEKNKYNSFRNSLSSYMKCAKKYENEIHEKSLIYFINIHLLLGGKIVRGVTEELIHGLCLYLGHDININDIDIRTFMSELFDGHTAKSYRYALVMIRKLLTNRLQAI
jgi:hypothetical protein